MTCERPRSVSGWHGFAAATRAAKGAGTPPFIIQPSTRGAKDRVSSPRPLPRTSHQPAGLDPNRPVALPKSGQSRVAAAGRRNIRQQYETDPLVQPAPAHEFDQRVAWWPSTRTCNHVRHGPARAGCNPPVRSRPTCRRCPLGSPTKSARTSQLPPKTDG